MFEFLKKNQEIETENRLAALQVTGEMAKAGADSAYVPPNQHAGIDVIEFTQGFGDDLLEYIWYTLGGYHKENGKYVKPVGATETINQVGRQALLNRADPLVHRNTINSNFSSGTISQKLKRFIRDVRHLLITHRVEYGLGEYPSVILIDNICNSLLDHAEPTVLRALNNGERTFMSRVEKVVHARTETVGNQQKKVFGVI